MSCSRLASAVILAAACTPAEVPVAAVPLVGDCSAAPAMGDLAAYGRTIATVAPTDTGEVRVRSCAVWPGDDLRNVVGTIAAGREIPVFGPVKHEPFSAGVGYVVPVQDAAGQQCRGYVSASVIASVRTREGADDPRAGLPLPDASAAWSGPCLATE